MEPRKHISVETKEISPIVEQVGPLNPFSVPADYFESFPLRMLALARKAGDFKSSFSSEQPYAVPAGYFESLPQQLLNTVKGASDEDAASEIQSLSGLLAGLDRKMPFKAPDGYFEELAENVTDGAKVLGEAHRALESPASILSLLKDRPTYSVPENYFDNLPEVLLNKATDSKSGGALVVKRNFGAKFIRYAVAAMVIGAIAISGLLFFDKGDNQSNGTTPAVAGIEQVPVEELEKYMDNQLSLYSESSTITTSTELDGDDVKEFLSEFSDEALQQYVNQYTDKKTNLN